MPDVSIALPTAKIAVMGPEAAINAVYYNRIQGMEEPQRSEWIAEQRRAFEQDIDVYRLAAELIVDDIVPPDDLRAVLIERFRDLESKHVAPFEKKRPVTPV